MPKKREIEIIDGVEHYKCFTCNEFYSIENFYIIKKTGLPNSSCKACVKQNQNRQLKTKRKEMNNIDLRGTTDSDRQEVIEVMKRAGYTTDKPFHEQFYQRMFEKYGILLK